MAMKHKTKQYLLALAKVLVLTVTFGYIFFRLKYNSNLDLSIVAESILSKGNSLGYFILLFLSMSCLNWLLEIYKWKALISTIKKINFKTAAKQSLAALTVSLATPNRIGDYGAKALFFPKEKRRQVLALNLYSNNLQLLATVIFGTIGLLFFILHYNIAYSFSAVLALAAGISILLVLAFFLREKELFINGLSIAKILRFYKKIPLAVTVKTAGYSIMKYLTFSFLFFCVLSFFGAEIAFPKAMALIFSMYLLVSIVPTIFIFDVVVRGGVAVWIFSFEGISDLMVLSTVLTMWILNFVLPSLLGGYHILHYKPVSQ